MIITPDNCFHLTTEIVHEIHFEAIQRFGGSEGIRDIPLLESAIATPQANFNGKSLYEDIVEVAAAYLFYLCQNHPFMDGNKRTALGACIVFLRLNDVGIKSDSKRWEELVMSVANGMFDRNQTTYKLRELLSN